MQRRRHVGDRQLAGDRPWFMTITRSASGDLVEFDGDDQHRRSRRRASQRAVDEPIAPMSTPRVAGPNSSTPGDWSELARQHQLLLVAAGETRASSAAALRAHVEAPIMSTVARSSRRVVHPAPAGSSPSHS